MGYAFGVRSRGRLAGVDSRLVRVLERAIGNSPVDFTVLEGLRTTARQRELYAQGRTKPGDIVTWTLKSPHIEGRAVDIAPVDAAGKVVWPDQVPAGPARVAAWKAFDDMAAAVFKAAGELGVEVRWGADWDRDGKPRERGETDSPHFEVPR